MRVLLINPFYPISETPSPPLGLAYLAAALENAGHTVKICDYVVMPYGRKQLASELDGFQPRMVGVTAVTMTVNQALAVIRDVKSTAPDIITVAGGPHVTFRAEQTLRDHSFLDIIVRGEGEATVVELADAVESGRPWDTVRGIVFRRETDIHTTADRPFIADIDALAPPARHLLPLGRYRALHMPVSMITSRGCPFQCIFCVGRKMVGGRVRYRDPVAVVDEMADLNRLNFHQINIAHDLFTARPSHCMAVCDEILRRGLKICWTSFARVDTVSPAVLERMKAAGCTGVSFGVETADPDILKTVRKGITTDQVIRAVRLCNDAGIQPYASFILGLPGETPDTLNTTLAFAQRLEEMDVSYGFHLLAPFPGTEIGDRHNQYDLKILTDDWAQYHANRAIVETASVTAKMLDDIVIRWEQRYDRYLGDIADRMAKGKISDEEAWPLVCLERTVTIYDLMMDRVIEKKGFWRDPENNVAGSQTLDMLTDRVREVTGKSRDKIFDALAWAVEQENLECHRENGQVRWEWVDRL